MPDVQTRPETAIDLEREPERAPAPSEELRAWLGERIDRYTPMVVAGAWFVLLQVAAALEPAPARAEPAIGVLLALAMYTLLAVMVTGLVMHRRFGLVASLAAAVLAAAASIACPITGHHQFGTWWYGQMACVLALVAISVASLRRPSPAPAPAEPTEMPEVPSA